MPSLSEFSRRIFVRAEDVQHRADELTRKVALAIDQAIVMGTPVDTGRARSNWIVQLDDAPDTVIPPYSPGEAGSTSGANTQAALDQGQRTIQGYTTGRVIHIVNNLPYIQRLNDGWSRQAPAHYVEKATLEAARAVQSFHLIK